MLTLTGNGRLTRDAQLRTTHTGKTVATISIASAATATRRPST